VARLRRDPADLERLGLKLGRGIVIAGPPGSGKTLMARALASAAGRDAIAPPVAELTPELIARLYAQLARMEPAVVILDEAEVLIGNGRHMAYQVDTSCQRALLVALDGMARPERGPLTVALTTWPEGLMDAGVTRAGRLAPRLELGPPTPEDRRTLFERAIARVPQVGDIDTEAVVVRTGGWTGAEIDIAVQEAVSRSLLDGTDALTMDLLLAVVGERYRIQDEQRTGLDPAAVARHEAGHAIYGHLVWPGRIAYARLNPEGGATAVMDEQEVVNTASGLRSMAGMALAGMATDWLIGGPGAMTPGADTDRRTATRHLRTLYSVSMPWEPAVLEGDGSTGGDRMRDGMSVVIEREAVALYNEVIRDLAPRLAAIRALGDAILAAPGHTLSGNELTDALAVVLSDGRLDGD
jgi:SpoVK/Ycf46/Vps4 family AAA+-type ATPase